MRRLMTAILFLSLGFHTGWAQEVYTPPIYNIEIPQEIRLEGGKSLPLISEQIPVTLREAVKIGLTIHENIEEAEALVAQAVARIAQSRAPALPSVNLSVTQTDPLHYNVATGGGGLGGLSLPGLSGLGGFGSFNQAPKGPQEQLAVRQLLYDFNRTRSAVKMAEANTLAAQANLEVTRQQLAFDISTAYLDLLQSERLAEVQLSAAENQAVHISEAQKLYEVGIGLPVDVARAQTEYARGVRQYTEQRNRSLVDRVELATLMGADPRTPFKIVAPEIEVETDLILENLVSKALVQRAGLAKSQAELESKKYSLENAQASNRPRLSTTLNFSANQMTPQPQTESISLMINFEWPLYDGGLARAQADEARAGIAGAEASLSKLQRQIIRDVSVFYVSFKDAQQNLVTSDIEVKGADESQEQPTVATS